MYALADACGVTAGEPAEAALDAILTAAATAGRLTVSYTRG